MEKYFKQIIIDIIIIFSIYCLLSIMYSSAKWIYDVKTMTLTTGVVVDKVIEQKYKGGVDRIVIINTEKYGVVSEDFEVVSFTNMEIGDSVTWKYNYLGEMSIRNVLGLYVWGGLICYILYLFGCWLFKTD